MNKKTIERSSTQKLMPKKVDVSHDRADYYRLYPFHSLGSGKIHQGFDSLVSWISTQKTVQIDGYVGVSWDTVRSQLDQAFKLKGLRVNWIRTEDFLKPSYEIDSMVKPFLGTDDSVWGKNTTLQLRDFFRMDALEAIELDKQADLNVILGVGAALTSTCLKAERPEYLIYMDLPKNELLYRMRAHSIFNLGSEKPERIADAYKRFYFVDWVVLNEHKKNHFSRISVMVDAQWPDMISWSKSVDLREGMKKISHSVFRPRPWFDHGIWGGQWMKEKIPGLETTEGNLAWSFEIIAPECGLVFESDGNLLEVSFDTLMFAEAPAILGRHFDRFEYYFPIRFDFLDTFDGGNLSIQCHPSLSYIQENFGEKFTQDETYYMLDCTPDSKVYLGFKEDIKPEEFRKDLEDSVAYDTEINVEKYIQTFNAEKHDLFLIPNRTVHSSGRHNMVLEISATPYIFTFKMYDWLQKDSEGKPRPINIDHAFHNLDFERKGVCVTQELIAKPSILRTGDDWKLIHLPTHTDHYYDIHRMEFETTIKIDTEQVCHILMLVEGETIEVETDDGTLSAYNYAETFIIPAAAKHYTLTNKSTSTAKVIKAFVKYDKYQYENHQHEKD